MQNFNPMVAEYQDFKGGPAIGCFVFVTLPLFFFGIYLLYDAFFPMFAGNHPLNIKIGKAFFGIATMLVSIIPPMVTFVLLWDRTFDTDDDKRIHAKIRRIIVTAAICSVLLVIVGLILGARLPLAKRQITQTNTTMSDDCLTG